MRYLTEYEAKKEFDCFLDDVYPMVDVCGYKYAASRALAELDPIAYDMEYAQWCDAEGITHDDGMDKND